MGIYYLQNKNSELQEFLSKFADKEQQIHNILISPDYALFEDLKRTQDYEDLTIIEVIQQALQENHLECLEVFQDKGIIRVKCKGNLISLLMVVNNIQKERPWVQIAFKEVKKFESSTESTILIMQGKQKTAL